MDSKKNLRKSAFTLGGTKSGFTLAEVLITLGIIGVVAAMTMPTLLNSTQGAQYRTAYKKALSVLSQAIVLNVALDDYDTSQTTGTDAGGTTASLYNLFANRMNVVATNGQTWPVAKATDGSKSVDFTFGDSENYTFFFNDGIVLSFDKDEANCTEASPCKGVIDVNGNKNPNRVVSCDSSLVSGKGENQTNAAGTATNCTVDSPTDVYPIRIQGQSILPNSDAARAVMYSGK